MKAARSRFGFTLIELLVVIGIIALISSIGLMVYTLVGPKSRDAKRKLDVRNIAQALDIYYQSNKYYPRTPAGQFNLSSGSFWILDDGSITPKPFDSNYIETMPKDPKSDGGNPITDSGAVTTTGYAYWSGSISCSGWPGGSNTDGGQYFILGATLEDQTDGDRNAIKLYKNCLGAAITSNNNAFIITSPQ